MEQPSPLWFVFAFPFFFVALWASICLLLPVVSGWRAMVEIYPRAGIPEGETLRWRTASIGWVSYGNSLNLTAGRSYLHLSVPALFRLGHPPLSIPWSAIVASERSGLLGSSVELRLTGVPKTKILLSRKTAEALMTASRGRFEPQLT